MVKKQLTAVLVSLSWVLATGCGPSTFANLSGSTNGISISPSMAYWGGPFLVFLNGTTDCIDVWWIKRGPTYETGVDAPIDEDITVLLYTYEGSEVLAANNSVEGDSPVDARIIDISAGAVTVHTAQTGYLDISEINKHDEVIGNTELGFGDDGVVSGDFQVEWCNNLKSKN